MIARTSQPHLYLKTTINFYLHQISIVDLVDRTDSYIEDIDHLKFHTMSNWNCVNEICMRSHDHNVQ